MNRPVPWSALAECSGEVIAALHQVLGGTPAERVIDRTLRNNRGFSRDQRTAVVEAIFRVALWRRRLAIHAGSSDPASLLFALLRDLEGLSTAEAAYLSRIDLAPPSQPSPEAFADRHSLPDWLAQLISRELGAEAEAFASALNRRGPIFVRANLLANTGAQLVERLAKEGVRSGLGVHATTCVVLDQERPNILALDAFRSGCFEVQDEGSQLLGELVDARPGEVVLDYCAGAGGKTLQLAAQMNNLGQLHAFDLDASRLDRLRQRAARAGLRCLHIHQAPIPEDLVADRVLVDAPCSELGALRRGPDLRFRLDPAQFSALPTLQLEILDKAQRHVRPGGRLVYATCTFRREENDEVAHHFASLHPDFQPAQPFFRCFPHREGTDAFFAAVFERRSSCTKKAVRALHSPDGAQAQ